MSAHGFTIGADVDRPEFCACGAAFIEGLNLDAVKTAHIAVTR